MDKESTCVAVTTYNLANGQGVIIGDVVAVAMPFLKEINFIIKDKVFYIFIHSLITKLSNNINELFNINYSNFNLKA